MSFGNAAYKLSRNPLGIFALFLVFIYFIACGTFAIIKNLPIFLIWCYILFIILFPIFLSIMFCHLVIKHHTKLYAPEDFPRPEDFVSCAFGDNKTGLTRDQANEKLSETPEKKKE